RRRDGRRFHRLEGRRAAGGRAREEEELSRGRAMRRLHVVIGLVVVAVVGVAGVGCWYRGYLAGVLPSAAAEMGDITLPPGFHIAVYAGDVPNARQMALGPPGVVFVGSLAEGKVYAVRAEKVYVLASGL